MPEVVGREAELAAAAEFLADLERGPSALVFAGQPGIGKTALWQATIQRAVAASVVVLSARPAEAEAGLGFAALADLLDPVVEEVLAALPGPQRRALTVALLREEPGPGHLDQRAVAAATASVLRELARAVPVVVAVDDLQWLDPPSARVLGFAMRRLAGHPVGLLASERVERGLRLPLDLDSALPPERMRRIELGPLNLRALHTLINQRLGFTLPRSLIARIEHATGGNPFFTLEIARSLPDDADVSLTALPMPGRLLEMVEERVLALPPRSRIPLLAAAALRSPTIDRVTAAMDGRTPHWRRGLEHAEALGIIRAEGPLLRFTHPLYAAAVYATATATERRRVHRRLAELTWEVEERALHLALGAERADAGLAVVLDAAAEHARSRGAPESAAELVEWARILTPAEHPAEVQHRALQAAEYRFHAGELRSARELLEEVLSGAPDPPIQAHALRLLGEIRYHQESFPEAIQMFGEALEHVGDDLEIEAAIELRLAFSLRAIGDFARAEPHTYRALALAERLGQDALIAEALALVARLDFVLGRGLDTDKLNRALQLEDPHRQVALQLRPSVVAASLLLYAGQLARSVQMLEKERQRVLERGEDSDLPFVLGHLTWAECWRGNLAQAAAYAEESLKTTAQLGGKSVRCLSLVFAALVAAHRGDAERARQDAEQGLALAESTGWNIAAIWANWAHGVLAVSLEDAREANAALGPLATAVEEQGLNEPIRAMFLAEEIEALVALGQLDRAERLTGILHDAGTRLQRGWALIQAARCRALLLATRGELDRAAQAAHEGLTLGHSVELRLEVARTLLVAGQVERRRRKKHLARELLGQALKIFEDSGALLWERRARFELERGAGRPMGNQLTASEERVGQLAASGLTNREVAAQLFVSPKTVEATLARVYRKMGIRSRAELGARLADGGVSARG